MRKRKLTEKQILIISLLLVVLLLNRCSSAKKKRKQKAQELQTIEQVQQGEAKQEFENNNQLSGTNNEELGNDEDKTAEEPAAAEGDVAYDYSNDAQSAVSAVEAEDLSSAPSWEEVQEMLREAAEEAEKDEAAAYDMYMYQALQYASYVEPTQDNLDIYAQFEELASENENMYQSLVELDPELPDVLQQQAVYMSNAESPLGQHVVGGIAGMVFDTGETGQEIRKAAVELGYFALMALESLTYGGDELDADDIVVDLVTDDYVLMHTSGSINDLYRLTMDMLPYNQMIAINDKRVENLRQEIGLGDFEYINWETCKSNYEEMTTLADKEEYIEKLKGYNRSFARQEFLWEKNDEIRQMIEDYRKSYFDRFGFSDEDIVKRWEKATGESYQSRIDDINESYTVSEQELKEDGYTDEEIKKEIEDQKQQQAAAIDDLRLKMQETALEYYHIYTLMDKESTPKCSFVSTWIGDNICIYDNKYLSMSSSENLSDEICMHMVMDLDGNLVYKNYTSSNLDYAYDYENDERHTEVYSNPSSNGSYLRIVYDESFENGQFSYLEWIDSTGDSEKLLGDSKELDIYPVGGGSGWSYNPLPYNLFADYYQFNRTSVSDNASAQDPYPADGIIDMKNGKIITKEEYEKIVSVDASLSADEALDAATLAPLSDEQDSDNEESAFTDGYDVEEILNAGNHYQIDYDGENLYTKDGKFALDVSAGGGVKEIFYNQEQAMFYVVTKDDYYYAMDTEGQYTSEPAKMSVILKRITGKSLDDWGWDSWAKLTPYGLAVRYEAEIYTYFGEEISEAEYMKLQADDEDGLLSDHMSYSNQYVIVVLGSDGQEYMRLKGDLSFTRRGFVLGEDGETLLNLNNGTELIMATTEDITSQNFIN